MSFLCNVAAGQHTPKSILESCGPRNVILAPALTRTATLQLAVGTLRHTGEHWEHWETLGNTVAFAGGVKGGGVTTNLAVDQTDGAVDRRQFAGWGSASLKRSAHIASRCSQGATPALAARLRRCRLRSTVERVGGRPVRAQAPVAPQMHCMH